MSAVGGLQPNQIRVAFKSLQPLMAHEPDGCPLEGRFLLRRIPSFTGLYMLGCKCILSLSSLCGVLRLPPNRL
jgi:hypothetical protein